MSTQVRHQQARVRLSAPHVAVGVLSRDGGAQAAFINHLDGQCRHLRMSLKRKQGWHAVYVCEPEPGLGGRRYDELHMLLTSPDDITLFGYEMDSACILHVHHIGNRIGVACPGARHYQWRSLEAAADFLAKHYVAREQSMLLADRSDEMNWFGVELAGCAIEIQHQTISAGLSELLTQLPTEEPGSWLFTQLTIRADTAFTVSALAFIKTRLFIQLGVESEIYLLLSENFSGCALTWLGYRCAG